MNRRTEIPRSVRIRDLDVSPPFFLAPMAGVSHTALRRLVASYGGCGCFYTEMINARALPGENVHKSFFFRRSALESPAVYQIMTGSEAMLGPAAEALHQCGADAVDLNMGCGAASILRQGGGAALMRDPQRSAKLISGLRRRTGLPVVAKMRIGWKPDGSYLVDFCRRMEDAGADAVVVHARLCKDRFKRPVRKSFIAEVRHHLSIPVIGNGDIVDAAAALEMFEQTGCDGIMVGRAAVSRPWIFRDLKASLVNGEAFPEPPAPKSVFDAYVELLIGHFPGERQLGRLKEFTAYFARNFTFGHELWKTVQGAGTVEEAHCRALSFFDTHAAEVRHGYKERLSREIARFG